MISILTNNCTLETWCSWATRILEKYFLLSSFHINICKHQADFLWKREERSYGGVSTKDLRIYEKSRTCPLKTTNQHEVEQQALICSVIEAAITTERRWVGIGMYRAIGSCRQLRLSFVRCICHWVCLHLGRFVLLKMRWLETRSWVYYFLWDFFLYILLKDSSKV